MVAYSFLKAKQPFSKLGIIGAMFLLNVMDTKKWLLRMLMMQTTKQWNLGGIKKYIKMWKSSCLENKIYCKKIEWLHYLLESYC